jgi:hypothetical protein
MVTALGNITPLASDYGEIARTPLEADRCALLVVDIQEKLLPPIFQKEQLIRNSQLLIRLAGIGLVVWNGKSHLRGSNRAGGSPRRLHRSRGFGCRKFAH